MPPAPLVIELPPPPQRVTPTRGEAAQVTDTLPPPPTTTTTTLPPDWALPENSGAGRRVVYSKSRMRVWTVEADGSVSKTHLVSGRRTWNQPLPGTYSVFSRSRYTCNINNPYICWQFMVRFTKGPSGDNIGFHEIPTDTRTGYKLQSLSQLGQALSGGCVRQAPADAAFMWDWAPIGTPVVVLG
jgi:lipoprotein-anchoring transpeptidase ErfK/SrfK